MPRFTLHKDYIRDEDTGEAISNLGVAADKLNELNFMLDLELEDARTEDGPEDGPADYCEHCYTL